MIKDALIELCSIYSQKPEDELKRLLVDCTVPIQIATICYRYCVADMELPAIEMIPQETKKEVWLQAKCWFYQCGKEVDEEKDTPKLITLSRVIWLMKNLK